MTDTEIRVHSTACRAHAIGCAIENIRDAGKDTDPAVAAWAATANPITEGDGYLTSGGVDCICGHATQSAAPWILPGLDALDAAK